MNNKLSRYFDRTFGMWETYSPIHSYRFHYSELYDYVNSNLTKPQQMYIHLYTTHNKGLLGKIYGK